MLKDIPNLKVTDVAIAIVPRDDEEDFWDVYLVNLKDKPLVNVLVRSQGYGEVEGVERRTTTLRHLFEHIAPQTGVKIEPIQTRVFHMTNEYWISFTLDDYLYEKKFFFVPESITKDYLSNIPALGRQGVVIK